MGFTDAVNMTPLYVVVAVVVGLALWCALWDWQYGRSK